MSGPLKEPFEIKVYEIDDVERLQRRRLEKTDEVTLSFISLTLQYICFFTETTFLMVMQNMLVMRLQFKI